MTGVATITSPASVSELAARVVSAYLAGERLLIRGGGTHQSFANIGDPPDAIIQTTALDAIIDYSPVDLTLAVQAGRTLAGIDTLLAENGQRLAVDAPCRDAATIGGLFASGLSGPSRLRYGSLKDVVIGVEVLNSNGELTKSGGMVVKNVSGYEMARLHYGAHGAFGIVTRVNLKVLPRPDARRELQLAFQDARDCIEAGARVVSSTLDPAAVYVTGRHDGDWTLHVVIDGSSGFVEAQLQRVESAATDGSAAVEKSVEELDGIALPAFDAIIDLTNTQSEIFSRLSISASRQASVLSSLPDLQTWSVLADIGSGIVYLRCEAGSENLERICSIQPRAVHLAMPDRLKVGLDVFGGADQSAATVLRRLKAEFDPKGTFNQGRFTLGL